MINKILCSALLVIAPILSTTAFSQTRKNPVATTSNPMDDFDWDTEVETDMDLGYDEIPSDFDLVVQDVLTLGTEEDENLEGDQTDLLDQEDLMVIALSAGADDVGYADIAFGNVDALTVEFFEDFQTYFDNFDGSEWTDDLWAEGNSAEEESEMNDETLRPLHEAIDNMEFQLEADWENYSKDEPSNLSIDF
jgi:hypothetical protein